MIARIKNSKILSLMLILIILLGILLITRITYAYLEKEPSTPGVTKGSIVASSDRLIFTKGSDLALKVSTDNFYVGSGNVEAKTHPKVTLIANKQTHDAVAHYLVAVNITENSFHYSVGENQAELILTVKDENGEILEDCENLNSVTINGVTGFDITEKQGLINIITNKEITSQNSEEGESQEWEITLTLINLETDQSINETASIKIEIVMREYEEINSIEDLVRLSNRVNAGHTYEGASIVLTKDLDFTQEEDYEDSTRTDFGDINGNGDDDALIDELTTGSGFNPIGNSETNSFQGIFEGNNKEIANLYIANTTKNYIGLFGYINGAQINNLTITGNINSSRAVEAGGISGQGQNVIITNCQNKVNITVNAASQSVGGFVGTHGGISTIQNSQNYGNISNGNNTGGFIGNNSGTVQIDNSQNYGVITNDLGNHAGGFVGRDENENSQTTIINSHNEGNIGSNQENTKYIGGLVGKIIGNISIKDCYNSANVRNENSNIDNIFIGGLIGFIYNTSGSSIKEITISNSYNLGEIKNGLYNGGLVGYVQKITKPIIISNSYNSGNISSSEGYASSLVGMIITSPIYVLNSYNDGTLNSKEMSGLVWGRYGSNIYLINCYNIGKLDAADYASGLAMSNAWDYVTKNYIYLNNLYNAAEYLGTSRNYGIGWLNQATADILNTYYPDNVTYVFGGEVTTGGTSKAINDMKDQAFVDELNKNTASINLEEINPLLKDFKLKNWVLDENNYPTLVNE